MHTINIDGDVQIDDAEILERVSALRGDVDICCNNPVKPALLQLNLLLDRICHSEARHVSIFCWAIDDGFIQCLRDQLGRCGCKVDRLDLSGNLMSRALHREIDYLSEELLQKGGASIRNGWTLQAL